MKLSTFPSFNLIRVMRGHLDFYHWKGIPVCRRWPTTPRQPHTAKQEVTKANFRLMHPIIKSMPKIWHDNLNDILLPKGRTKEDIKRKIVMNWLTKSTKGWFPKPYRSHHRHNTVTNLHTLTIWTKATDDPHPYSAIRIKIFPWWKVRPSLGYVNWGTIQPRDGYVCVDVTYDWRGWKWPATFDFYGDHWRGEYVITWTSDYPNVSWIMTWP